MDKLTPQEELNIIIRSLEKEEKKLKGSSELYEQIKQVKTELSKDLSILKQESKTLSNKSSELEEWTSTISSQLNTIESKTKKLLTEIKDENSNFHTQKMEKIEVGFTDIKDLIDRIKSALDSSLKNFEKEITKNHEKSTETIKTEFFEIYNDNKKFQKELDSGLVSRLDKHKSDISVSIRDEGNQIQRALQNSLNENKLETKSELNKIREENSNHNKRTHTLLYVTIGISLISMVVSLAI